MLFKKRLIIIIASTVICAGLIAYKNYQMRKIPGLSFEEALSYTTRNNKDAVITVGIIKNGKPSLILRQITEYLRQCWALSYCGHCRSKSLSHAGAGQK